MPAGGSIAARREKDGVTDGIRTRDIQGHNLTLCQLSYGHRQNRLSTHASPAKSILFHRVALYTDRTFHRPTAPYTRAMDSAWSQLAGNTPIWVGLLAWAAAQSIKMTLAWRKTREFDFRYFVSTGGMPSAHSAAVCALAASVGFAAGLDSPIFAVALAFAVIVMFDAQSVRRAAGQQARLLNQIVAELFKEHHLSGHKLAELLGHTRLEVFFGMLLGILIAIAVEGVRRW